MDLSSMKMELEARIGNLEEQRTSLLAEIRELNERIVCKGLESKAQVLEDELARLREEKMMLEAQLSPPEGEVPDRTAEQPLIVVQAAQ